MWSCVGPMNAPPDSMVAPWVPGPDRWWLSTRPPARSRASRSSTSCPVRASSRAATSPEMPPPTTTASTCFGREPWREAAATASCRAPVPSRAPVAAALPRTDRRVSVMAAPGVECERVSDSVSYPTLVAMPAAATPTTSPKRRVPRQERSRRRVEGLLDAAARLVVERGVEALTTRDIAEAARAPVASLYQYFSDKEDVLLALAQRDMDEMDDQVAEDLAAVDVLTVGGLVRTTMSAFVKVYHRRRAFVEIYLRGRTNAAVARFGRDHNLEVAEVLRAFAVDA